ncbi:hypothetical protein [Niastella sp. OAS944]|uniref:hypothetical protein n=1 Tax=Niastella sp. OAS944 TaxID=2664089 RepID=UPI003471B030|nr:hypothetical protein [Chitinophagaceae bacterium OAS944]
MANRILSSVRSFFRLITLLIFAAVLGVLAWGSWQLYKNEKELQQFIKEGHPVKVQVTATDRQNLTWYDQFSNKVYITFNYNNRLYTSRYVQDSGWVYVGDKVTLLYHPELDGFRQLNRQMHFNKPSTSSRLISFSFMGRWNEGQKWLLLTLMLTTVFTLIALSILAGFLQIPLLGHIGRFIVTGLVVGVALYFTYNAWQYNQYYNKIRNNSKSETVTVLSTNYHARSKRNSWFYDYDATVQFGNEQKTIPIEEEDFEKLKANDKLEVLYNKEENDMMSVNYSADSTNIFVALFMWGFAIFFIYTSFFKRKAKSAASH